LKIFCGHANSDPLHLHNRLKDNGFGKDRGRELDFDAAKTDNAVQNHYLKAWEDSMSRVAVIGATGYAGAELVRILAGHPDVELTCLTSRQYAGVRFDQIYPSLTGWVNLVCQALDIDALADSTDVVFTALPHKLPMAIIPQLIDKGVKVVDLSADFRFRDLAAYERHYQPHSAPELIEKAVYGLSEVYSEQIRQAQLVGNPGCYPTSILLPLIPLIRADLIDTQSIIADAKSGVSGAGRSATLTTHFCQVSESFKPYKVGAHRHTPEMEAILQEAAEKPVPLTFVPHLVPMSRGMQTTIYTKAKQGVTNDDVLNCFYQYYQGRPFIRICGTKPADTLNVKGTNCCDIGCLLEGRTGRLILMSAIDNLVKGAAGQAVQNMNMMLGLDETRGLLPPAYPI
jgi:N-acetyl-gamma-glutamyl-phosphate reductase